MTEQNVHNTTNWPQIVFAGALQHTAERTTVKMDSVFLYKSPFGAFSACARFKSMLKQVSGLKQNRWPLAWVEQSHLSNLSILYGEGSEPCTRFSFRVLLLRYLMTPPPPPPTQMVSLLAGCLGWIMKLKFYLTLSSVVELRKKNNVICVLLIPFYLNILKTSLDVWKIKSSCRKI